MSDKRMIVFLTGEEKDHFFSGIPIALLESLEIDFKMIDPTEAEDCRGILNTYAPEIILGGWSMPALPLESIVGKGGSVEYLCYLGGDLSRQLKEEHFQAGLTVTNWGKTTAPYVAECALLLILSGMRQVAKYGFSIKQRGGWRPQMTGNRSLFGKRVGLHGFGTVAQHLVPLLEPFQCEFIADTGVPKSLLNEFGVSRTGSTLELFEKSDVVVELKSLTEKTQRSVGKELLNAMVDGSCFVNVVRGPVVVEEELIEVARKRNIQFALDYFDERPLSSDSPLLSLENVLLLPQMGGATSDRGYWCGKLALRNLRHYLDGKPVENQLKAANYAFAH